MECGANPVDFVGDQVERGKNRVNFVDNRVDDIAIWRSRADSNLFFFFHADTAHVLARMRTYKKMRARESARRDCELCKRREKRVLLYRAPIG